MKRPYVTQDLPLSSLDYIPLVSLISEANSELGIYNGLLEGMLDPEIMITPIIQDEATLSSKIEGTQATSIEVLEYEAGISIGSKEKQVDIQEIVNY